MRMLFCLIAASLLAGCGGNNAPDTASRENAIAAAKDLYQQKRAEGVDMTNGPCLGVVLETWAVDVAHEPRQPVDDLPANQCEAFRAGEVSHFVELDPEGNLIRAQ